MFYVAISMLPGTFLLFLHLLHSVLTNKLKQLFVNDGTMKQLFVNDGTMKQLFVNDGTMILYTILAYFVT